MKFLKGHAKVGGRKKGSLNKRTRKAMKFFEDLVTDPKYLKSLRYRLQNAPDPGLEIRCLDGAWGKPIDPNRQAELKNRMPPQLPLKGSICSRNLIDQDDLEC